MESGSISGTSEYVDLVKLEEVCRNAEGHWAPFHPATSQELRDFCVVATPSEILNLIARIRELENHRDQAVDVATRLDEIVWRYKEALERIANASKADLKPDTGQWAAGCAWVQSIAESALR